MGTEANPRHDTPRYAEPTAQQLEEAAALLFLAATQKALHNAEHLWDLRLELEVSYTVHNQRCYRVHAATRTGETITGDKGFYVHPANGTPENTAWGIAMDARRAAGKRKQNTERILKGRSRKTA
ncbi:MULTISPECIES: hypothetical protein [Arthrobacter]|uniref:Uncharacterized protein n=1 Tax=Arthrobacter terricola TaxID=2547396 RepID=A0A4R5K983_9MICC|nr:MULTISPECIES: hypothetical protein [Arthrobacter]MBT8163206.1 hypothetical protein [Arthrobacter sp. GN70]TDF91536.1 hypothetical protein E1809_20635 [Arthrobacter terricola]